MPSGGYRPGGGRPRGSKNLPKVAPEPTAEKPELEEPGKRAKSFSRDQAESAAISSSLSTPVPTRRDGTGRQPRCWG
jgi:hypothetical protein